jgi:hypothetical protein
LVLAAQEVLVLATLGWMEITLFFRQLLQLVAEKVKLAIPQQGQAALAAVVEHCCFGVLARYISETAAREILHQ